MDIREQILISILIRIAIQVIIPIAFAVQIVLSRRSGMERWPLYILSVLYILFVYFTGDWSIVPYYLRNVIPFVLLVPIAYSIRFRGERIVRRNLSYFVSLAFHIFMIIVFFALDLEVIRGIRTDDTALELAFPLRKGFIYHGGNSPIINYHNVDTLSQRYAMDIVALNRLGMRAYGLFPDDLEEYVIFEDTVFSPCDCSVLYITDGLPDMPPGVMDTSRPAGNHVVLKVDTFLVLLAHLRQNSIKVKSGDWVSAGQPIALVGNSGNTSEPHLHIHAAVGEDFVDAFRGRGVPISFGGKFPIRNDIFSR